jgi:hypothetical protein
MTNTDKRTGWERMPGTHDIDNGKGKVYRGLVRFERPCATCGESFGIYVTQGTADGETRNSSFGLRNCEKHRMRMAAPGTGIPSDEAEKLRTANTTMKEELEGLYARNSALYAENEILKARLGVYELPTIEVPKVTAWSGNGMAKAPDPTGEMLRRQWAEKNNVKKMPWDS